MGLPAPNLDDRGFQALVDDAKRLVQRRCPEWTDHNVSDPGVTLIEACAQMVDQLIYRLNRVPDRHYVKFLELIGVELHPSSAARGEVTFWLSAPQPQSVLVRSETEVATPRTDVQDPVVLTTVEDLPIVACSRRWVGSQPAGGEAVDRTQELGSDDGLACFSSPPRPGDALLVGLSAAVPSCVVRLSLTCRVAGVGIDPDHAPLTWEAWSGSSWIACDVQSDDTGGLNRPGNVVLHVPARHRASVLMSQRAGWLRCRLRPTEEDEDTYTASPVILDVTAATVGGTVGTVHAECTRDEYLGVSDGTPAQRFRLAHRPVVPWDEPCLLHALDPSGVQDWVEVADFADSGPESLHFHIEATSGEVRFGPAVREADGSVRNYGAVPPRGAPLVMEAYHTGGGRRGNVAKGSIRVLKTSVPYVDRVENRAASVGGADEETLANAMARGPLLLRTRDRAVTAEDFEALAREVAPEAARVHCVPATDEGEAGGVRVLVVPHLSGDEIGRVSREELEPPEGMLARIARRLDERRLVGTRVVVEPPDYRWMTAIVSLTARARHRPEQVSQDVLRALYRLFHPLLGGSEGTGWPLGRAVQSQEILAALAEIPGVDIAEDVTVQLFPADPGSGRREAAVRRLELSPLQLVLSYEHQVMVRA